MVILVAACGNLIHYFHFQDKLDLPKDFKLVGIKHLDYASYSPTVTFIGESIGQQKAVVQVRSQPNRGINSIFVFYGDAAQKN